MRSRARFLISRIFWSDKVMGDGRGNSATIEHGARKRRCPIMVSSQGDAEEKREGDGENLRSGDVPWWARTFVRLGSSWVLFALHHRQRRAFPVSRALRVLKVIGVERSCLKEPVILLPRPTWEGSVTCEAWKAWIVHSTGRWLKFVKSLLDHAGGRLKQTSLEL